MQVRKIGMYKVMKDNSMEDGLQHRDDEGIAKKKCEEITHDAKWLYQWVVCNRKRHDAYENQLL